VKSLSDSYAGPIGTLVSPGLPFSFEQASKRLIGRLFTLAYAPICLLTPANPLKQFTQRSVHSLTRQWLLA
jgi:hypothetical protein